jgi:adenosylcobinamide-phosphate synthase
MADPVAITTLMLDAAIGWPGALYRRIGHPVGLFAALIDQGEGWGNRSHWSFARRRAMGIVTMILLLVMTGGLCWLAQVGLTMTLGGFGWIGVALLAWPALAQRSLHDHVLPVAQALESGDLAAAQRAVGMIVGRDTAGLDESGVARAAIESLGESFCDGVAAPLFWLIVGGLPGVWCYKAINTADSLIGHREERWRAFGWAAARIDDVANLIPARLGGMVLCIAGMGGWRTMARDHGRHASPNAGWTEAAMAGALGLRLAGPIVYDGVGHDKPWFGSGRAEAGAGDIRRALRLYRRACLLLWGIAAVFAWV